MGVWGHFNFENDSALDFLADFRETPTEAVLLKALTVVVEAGEEEAYIELDEASAALMAAEVVSASVTKLLPDSLEDLRAVVEDLGISDKANIRKLACKAVRVVLKKSELQELWSENGEPNEWQAVQRDLLIRLE